MLQATATLAGALVAPVAAAQLDREGSGRRITPQPSPAPERVLINRVTYGWTSEEETLFRTLGWNGYLDYHLAPELIDDSALEGVLQRYPTLFLQPYEMYSYQRGQAIRELSEAAIWRAHLTKRQLLERMVEFWTDHFNINIADGDCAYLKTIDDREVIRRHALGRFRDLIGASAHSPVMLIYLDNYVSRAGNPNQNYARELMELHTLGVDGGYTQQDVIEVARCFTGWTVYGAGFGNLRGTYRYVPSVHDNGSKRVLGVDIPAGQGQMDGETVLDILAAHPSTARYVCRKLVAWFWGENPPEGLVDLAVQAWTGSGGDIKQVVRTILGKPFLTNAPRKFKRPFHLFVGAMRAIRPNITSLNAFRQAHLQAAGHLTYTWGPPDGFPDSFAYWSGLLLPRWNFGFSLMSNQIGGMLPDMGYLQNGQTTAEGLADRISQLVYGGHMDPATRRALVNYMLPDPVSATKVRDAFALALGLPSFQWC